MKQPAPTGGVSLSLLGATRLLPPSGKAIVLPLNDALMLAVLALDGPKSREQLAHFLWPGKPISGARNNLRQRIKRLTDASEGMLFADHGKQLALASDVTHDLAGLAVAAVANPDAARGALLGNHQVADIASASSQWLQAARARVDIQRGQAIEAHVGQLLNDRRFDLALAAALRLVADHPEHEGYAQLLMLAQHGTGDRAAALASGDALATRLRKSGKVTGLGASTRELLAQIRAEPTPLSRASTPPTRPTEAAFTKHPAPPPSVAAPNLALWAALMRPPQLVQREADWLLLQAVWQRGGMALVEGEAGIGKTRLLGDFAQAYGVQWQLRAHHGDTTVPYALLARWVDVLLPRAGGAQPWVRAELARLAPSLGEPAVGPLMPLRLAKALKSLLLPSDSAWFDDLHFADPASLELLPHALEPLHCCLLATRREQFPPSLERWLAQAAPTVQRLALKPWDQPAVQQVLMSTGIGFASADHRSAWAGLLWRHTGGHPLLLLETLRNLPLNENQVLDSEVPATLNMPPRVLQLLQHRLPRLSDGALRLAQVGALADDSFDAQLAARVLGLSTHALGAAWEELQSSGFMSASGRLHDLVLDAVRAGMASPWRTELSGAIASHLLPPKAPPAKLAHLWEAAGQPALAAAAHEQAANAADRLGQRGDVTLHWLRSADCWRDCAQPDKAFAADAEAAESMVRSGNLASAIKSSERLLSNATAPAQRAWACYIQAGALLFGGQQQLGLEAAEQVEAHCGVDRPHFFGISLALRALALAALGRRREAVDMVVRARAMPPLAHLPRSELGRQSTLVATMAQLGMTADALTEVERSLENLAFLEFASERVAMLNNCAHLLLKLGLPQHGLARARQGLEVASQIGESTGSPALLAGMHVAIFNSMAGQYKAARLAFEAALKLTEAPGFSTLQAVVTGHAALMWTHLGQADRAFRLLNGPTERLTPRERVQHAALRAELQRMTGVRSASANHDAALLQNPPEGLDPDVAAHAKLQHARQLPAPEAAHVLGRLQADLEDRGLIARALQVRVAWLHLLTTLRSEDLAATAQQVRDQLAQRQPTGYWPEAQWVLFQALRAAGDAAGADQALATAWQWLQQTLAGEVEEPFQASFMQRNLVNAQIQRAWRARRGDRPL